MFFALHAYVCHDAADIPYRASSLGEANVTDRDLELLNDSLERCSARGDFIDYFYDLFLQSSEEVAEKFAHTDFRKQKRMLKASFYLILLANEGKPEGRSHLKRIAQLHSRQGVDVRPGLYELWLDSLMQTVRAYDPQWTEEIEQVWRQMLRPGIIRMQTGY